MRIIVQTDDGREVARSSVTAARSLANLTCSMNADGWRIASWLRRSCEDAEAIEQGLDPERPSEKAMRLSEGES